MVRVSSMLRCAWAALRLLQGELWEQHVRACVSSRLRGCHVRYAGRSRRHSALRHWCAVTYLAAAAGGGGGSAGLQRGVAMAGRQASCAHSTCLRVQACRCSTGVSASAESALGLAAAARPHALPLLTGDRRCLPGISGHLMVSQILLPFARICSQRGCDVRWCGDPGRPAGVRCCAISRRCPGASFACLKR